MALTLPEIGEIDDARKLFALEIAAENLSTLNQFKLQGLTGQTVFRMASFDATDKMGVHVFRYVIQNNPQSVKYLSIHPNFALENGDLIDKIIRQESKMKVEILFNSCKILKLRNIKCRMVITRDVDDFVHNDNVYSVLFLNSYSHQFTTDGNRISPTCVCQECECIPPRVTMTPSATLAYNYVQHYGDGKGLMVPDYMLSHFPKVTQFLGVWSRESIDPAANTSLCRGAKTFGLCWLENINKQDSLEGMQLDCQTAIIWCHSTNCKPLHELLRIMPNVKKCLYILAIEVPIDYVRIGFGVATDFELTVACLPRMWDYNSLYKHSNKKFIIAQTEQFPSDYAVKIVEYEDLSVGKFLLSYLKNGYKW